jgi:hypothetical protein
LPGSRRERQLLRSFARMAPELLRHSANPNLADRFAEHLRSAHRPSQRARAAPRASMAASTASAASVASAPADPRGASAAPKTVSESLTSLWESDAAPSSSSNTCQRGVKRVQQSTITANEDEEEAFGELFEGF